MKIFEYTIIRNPHEKHGNNMTLIINNYSFVIFGLLILLIAALFLWRILNPQWAIGIAVVTFALLVTFQLFASTKPHTVSNMEDFNTLISSGKPVLLELYSNF